MELEMKLNKNNIKLNNLFKLDQNFGTLFDYNASIIYENCKEMQINFDSKINKLILKKCSNINININGLISGLEIDKSHDIIITAKNNSSFNNILITNSYDIILKSSNDKTKNTFIEVDKSKKISFC